jgi:ATP-dependent exoDNAse (exonuclease V) beta subunit
MTLHKSKGLEYDHVWIGHMNEEILMSEKASAFTLPESSKGKNGRTRYFDRKTGTVCCNHSSKAILYDQLRAKRDDGAALTLAHIVEDLSDEHFHQNNADDNESVIIE